MHAATRHIDTVIFDLGGVLMTNGRHSDLVRRFPPEHADAALLVFMGEPGSDSDHPWHRLERGELAFAEWQDLHRAKMEAAGLAMLSRPEPAATEPGAAPAPLIAFQPNDAMMDLAARLRHAGLRTGILTNNVAEFRSAWRGLFAYEDLFDDIVDSHEVGLRKPNPAIYQLAVSRLNGEIGRTAFLDDLPANVDAATALGMHGVLVDEDAGPAIIAVERLAAI